MTQTTTIETQRLLMTPLAVDDAAAMAEVLAASDLYTFTGGEPPTFEQLEARYRAQVRGSSAPSETWHNWIVRISPATPVGYTQATVTANQADVAWVVGVEWQGQGFAREAAVAMCDWLRQNGVTRISAHIHPRHAASAAVAIACGLHPTEAMDADGERVWATADL
jgi:RimJ/RimL family protein N-acetyltransferase